MKTVRASQVSNYSIVIDEEDEWSAVLWLVGGGFVDVSFRETFSATYPKGMTISEFEKFMDYGAFGRDLDKNLIKISAGIFVI